MTIEQQLIQYKAYIDSLTLEVNEDDYQLFNNKIEILEVMARVENSSLTIIDLNKKKYLFVRSRVEQFIELQPEEARNMDSMYFFRMIHPDDLPKVIENNTSTIGFLQSLPVAERKNYKFVSEFRFKNKTQGYTRFIQQVAVLETDRNGNPWLMLMLHDVSPNQVPDKSFQRSIINTVSNTEWQPEQQSHEKGKQLSAREKEVLELLAKGLMSKEIAGQLFLSVNTVNNHRQKIIEKMEVENTAEAIIYAKRFGLI